MTTTTTTTNNTPKFEVGKTYFTRSTPWENDIGGLRTYTVVRRTEKSVWFDNHGPKRITKNPRWGVPSDWESRGETTAHPTGFSTHTQEISAENEVPEGGRKALIAAARALKAFNGLSEMEAKSAIETMNHHIERGRRGQRLG